MDQKIKKERDSQFELLRIVAMFFVVSGHLIIKGADTVGLLSPYNFEEDGFIGVIIYSGIVGGGEFIRHDNGLVRREKDSAWLCETICGLSCFRFRELLPTDASIT